MSAHGNVLKITSVSYLWRITIALFSKPGAPNYSHFHLCYYTNCPCSNKCYCINGSNHGALWKHPLRSLQTLQGSLEWSNLNTSLCLGLHSKPSVKASPEELFVSFLLFHLRMKTSKKIERLDSFHNLTVNAGRRNASVLIYYWLHHRAELLSTCFSPLLHSFEVENEVTPYPPAEWKSTNNFPHLHWERVNNLIPSLQNNCQAEQVSAAPPEGQAAALELCVWPSLRSLGVDPGAASSRLLLKNGWGPGEHSRNSGILPISIFIRHNQ